MRNNLAVIYGNGYGLCRDCARERIAENGGRLRDYWTTGDNDTVTG